MAVPTTTRFYRYKVESLKILFPDEGIHYTIDGKLVKGITIERDYEKDFFPVIKLDMSLQTELYYKVVQNKTTVKFHLRLQKYIYEQNSTKAPFKKDVFNETFVIFLDENTPFLNKDEYEKSKALTSSVSTPGNTPITIGGNEVSFYLFKEHDMNYSKSIVNAVITSGTMTDTIAYMLSSLGFTKTLMTPLDNKNVYKEIIIPPLTFLGNLSYLENQYGYYNRGALIFFDIDALYIINRTPKCTAYRRGEFQKTIFSIKSSLNSAKFNAGSYQVESESTTYINVIHTDISVISASVVKDQLEGNNRLLINPRGGFTIDVKPNVQQRGGGTYKVLYNKYNNSFVNSAEKISVETDSENISVALADADLESLTPNKEFLFKFEDGSIDKRIGGSYRITKSVIALSSEGEYLKMMGSAIFKK